MDPAPMDYMIHGSAGLSPPHADHLPPSGWLSQAHGQPHGSPPAHWSPNPAPPIPPFYTSQRPPHQPSHPIPIGQSGGLPPPDPSLRGYPLPEPLGMGRHGPWFRHYQQMQLPHGPVSGPAMSVQPSHLSMNGATASELPYSLAPPVNNRVLPFQTPGEVGLAPSVAAAEPHPSSRSVHSQPLEHPANNTMSQQMTPPFLGPPQHFSSGFSPRNGHHGSSAIPRASRAAASQPPSFTPLSHHPDPFMQASPPTDRRRSGHTRARRSMNARFAVADSTRDGDEDFFPNGSRSHATARLGHRTSQSLSFSPMEEASLRQMQVLRGAVSSNTKLIASRAALQDLRRVRIEDLPENERTCVICYNDYGVKTPEGNSEHPLQLPTCKHVFGDYCIKTWLEDSDSCPYCRNKLPSEFKHVINPTRALLNLMRLRTMPVGAHEDAYMRLVAGLPLEAGSEDPVLRQMHSAERRSLPDDAGENQRRIRPRRDSSEDSHSEDSDGSLLASAPSAPVRIPRERQWIGRGVAGQRRATHVSLSQVGAATVEETWILQAAQSDEVEQWPDADADALQVRVTEASERTSGNDSSSRPALEVSANRIVSERLMNPPQADQNRNRPW